MVKWKNLQMKLAAIIMSMALVMPTTAVNAFPEDVPAPSESVTVIQEEPEGSGEDGSAGQAQALSGENGSAGQAQAPSVENGSAGQAQAPSVENGSAGQAQALSVENGSAVQAAGSQGEGQAAPVQEAPAATDGGETAPAAAENSETLTGATAGAETASEQGTPAASDGNASAAAGDGEEDAEQGGTEAAAEENAAKTAVLGASAPSEEEAAAEQKQLFSAMRSASPEETNTSSETAETFAASVSSTGSSTGSAGSATSTTSTKGVYYYRSKNDNADIPDTYVYDDALLKGDSLTYNPSLATMSLSMVNASIAATRADYPDKSRNLETYLLDNGFTDFEANEDYKKVPTLETMGAACAHKKITDNGKTYTLLVIAPRSAGYKTEWGGNFAVGETGDHAGFAQAKDIVLKFAKEYVQKYGIEGDIKVWTAGGSRGAGVVNLVGADLLRDPQKALGDAVTLTPENLYCYTFGTPKTADVTSDDYRQNNDSLYKYIHNLSEANDVVGTFAPSDLGFDRYGETAGYVDPALKEDMLKFLKATSESMYKVFTGGGDPDNFKATKIDIQKLLKEKSLSFTAAENSYLTGKTQADYMQLMEKTMAEVFTDRKTYTEQYQGPMQRFFGYVYGGSGEIGTLFKGVNSSGYMIPAALSMYVSVALEDYIRSKSKAADAITNLQDSINELDAAIQTMKDEGLGSTDEFKNQMANYEQLKEKLKSAELQDAINKDVINLSWELSAFLYGKAMEAGLKPITTIDDGVKKELTSHGDSLAMTKVLSHLLLTDPDQTQQFGLERMKDQIVHASTTISNAGSFMIPHYNEVILSWLRAGDPNYKDFVKATSFQAAGYRRVFVEQPEGVDVTGIVRDSSGNEVAVFKNGQLISRTNNWIGMTTSDGGNWLRLPADDTYRIDFQISGDTSINLKVSDYSVEDGQVVSEQTKDKKYSWQDLALRPVDSATLVVTAKEKEADITAGADYYLELVKRFFVTYLMNGGTMNGSQADTVTGVHDEGTEITLPGPTREGYQFLYWDGAGYNAGDLFKVVADRIFNAVWKVIEKEDPDKQKDPDGQKNPEEETKPEAAAAKQVYAAAGTASRASSEKAADAPQKIDMGKWLYNADADVYYQTGISYCSNPADPACETLAVFVPGAYMNGTENGDGTYTCELNAEGEVNGFTAASAPIVMPVNTPGYSAQSALTDYTDVSAYTDKGFVYVHAGCRGGDAGAPAGVTDLKAAIRYIRYCGGLLAGDAESIFTFGMSGGGTQSAVVGASGDSDLYDPYLAEIGAVEGVSDAVLGSMCWSPITNLDSADEAYEWMNTPLYYLQESSEGYKTSKVAGYWGIRSGTAQSGADITPESSLALALDNYEDVEDVDLETAREAGQTIAESTGGESSDFIAWAEKCMTH